MPKSIAAGIGALVVLTCVCYLPGMRGGFVFDDETLIGNNPRINSAGGLERIWFSIEEYEYYPLSYSSFWLEWRLWGNNPTLYHVTNLALHVAAALLIWAVLSELSIPGAYLAALLFAVHPVNVEAVAWISQRRSVLAMVFFLLSALWYLRRGGEKQKRRRGEQSRDGKRLVLVEPADFFGGDAQQRLSGGRAGSVAVGGLVAATADWHRRSSAGCAIFRGGDCADRRERLVSNARYPDCDSQCRICGATGGPGQ